MKVANSHSRYMDDMGIAVSCVSKIKSPSKIEWDLTNGPRSVSCDRAIRYSGFFGVRSFVGPVGSDFLEKVDEAKRCLTK